MGSVGTPEILLILLIALLVFGPQKLPELGKSLGRAVREFKKASSELQETLEREVDEVKRSGEASEPLPKGALPPPERNVPSTNANAETSPEDSGQAPAKPELPPK